MRLGPRRTPAARRYRSAGRPAVRTPWREARFCALDLELTGLVPGLDQIVAVGMVAVEQGRVQLGDARYTLVASQRASSPGAILTHRLRDADLDGAPALDEAMELILDTLAGRVPIFHHGVIESAFLSSHLRRRGVRMPAAVDTEVLGLGWLSRSGVHRGSLSLSALLQLLGQTPDPAHHALADALSTAQAFMSLASLIEAGRAGPGPLTVGSLLEASVRTTAGSAPAPTR